MDYPLSRYWRLIQVLTPPTIYTFKSFGEKKEILEKIDRFEDRFSLEEMSYDAKNMLIVFKSERLPETQGEMDKMGEVLNSISKVVFEDLNEGEYRIGNMAGSSEGSRPDDEGYVNKVHFTIKWGNREEELILDMD